MGLRRYLTYAHRYCATLIVDARAEGEIAVDADLRLRPITHRELKVPQQYGEDGLAKRTGTKEYST